jgi:hypothetical protein
MNAGVINLILRQSYLHLLSYGLVSLILFMAMADAFLVWHLRRVLRAESIRFRDCCLSRSELRQLVHPAARSIAEMGERGAELNEAVWRNKHTLTEASLFVPLRTRMMLIRDLSTLMGLIATLLALVAAASDFARNGNPELLVGSVGTGCVATCVAAIGCAIAMWNLSRLTRLRLEVAQQTEGLFSLLGTVRGSRNGSEVPIQHLGDGPGVGSEEEEAHVSA